MTSYEGPSTNLVTLKNVEIGPRPPLSLSLSLSLSLLLFERENTRRFFKYKLYKHVYSIFYLQW